MQEFKTVGQLLAYMKTLQKESNMNSTEFASNIGISKQYLSDIYNSRREPSETVLDAIGVKTNTSYLATGKISFPMRRLAPSTPKRKKEKDGKAKSE